MVKAIETIYKGYRFRSRLEARWAVFLDDLGVEWQYEVEGFELPDGSKYLPDFHINEQGLYTPGKHTYGPWLEVKGECPTKREVEKMELLCTSLCSYGLLVWGMPGEENWLHFHKEIGVDDGSDSSPYGAIAGNCLVDYLLPGSWDWPRRFQTYQESVNAAKSARFEFGESGACR